jgi:hypoxanthine phosphoribosyltransferase
MLEKTWSDFTARLAEIQFGAFDLIVAIGSGGIIPAGFIQQKLRIPMKIINLNYRDEANQPRFEDAQVLEDEAWPLRGRKILLIDDVSRTGKTLQKALQYLAGNTICTCVINGESDYSFYRETECIKLPWKA